MTKWGVVLERMTLSKFQLVQYREIVKRFSDNKTMMLNETDYVRLKEVLLYLQIIGYIEYVDIDNTYMFRRIGDFSDFEKWHKEKVREERKFSLREWKIAIISALIGGIVGLIPTVINLIK